MAPDRSKNRTDEDFAPSEDRRGAASLWAKIRHRPRRALVFSAISLLLLLFVLWLVPTAVDTAAVERREVVETLVTTGRVRSVSRAALGAPMGGTVERVLVEEGDSVAAGEVVITLESRELSAAADEARARLAAAEAALRRVANLDAPTATAALAAAQLEAEQLARDVERMRALFEAGGLSRQELEQAERNAESARSRLEGAAARVRGVAEGGADRRVAEAAVAQAAEGVEAADARLDLTRLRSPAAGTVLIRNVEPGSAVQPGAVLMEIAMDGPTELVAFPDERSLAGLRVGQSAIASADAYPDRTFAAQVDRIAPLIDPQQGTVEVQLGVPTPPDYLIPDMTVSVNIEMMRRQGAATLPLDVVGAPLTDTAWVMTVRDGRATRVPVEIGVRDERYVEVVNGVEEGDRIIVDPAQVTPGDRVRARERR